jgi:hypothetical protein
MLSTLRMILNDWQRLYRHNGGIRALLRSIQGTIRLTRGGFTPREPSLPGVDVITFSVVPKMTALWTNWIRAAVDTSPLRVYIGDCSGTLGHYLPNDDAIRVLPMLNYHHGEKLDLFVKHLCRTEYVIVTDDDIFWLDTIPWRWALEQFEQDPQVAVVSLLPFKHMLAVLQDKVPFPMGSCFVIRRKVWMDEQLSFRVDRSPKREGKWIYDTGAKAQVQLVERGYKIVYAPQEIQDRLEGFEGMSSWMLKIQKQEGNILENISGDAAVRPAKAFRAVLAAKGLADLISHFPWGRPNPDLISRPLLERSEAVCTAVLPPTEAETARESNRQQFQRLQAGLPAMK